MSGNDHFYFKDLLVWKKAVDFAKDVITVAEENNSPRKHFRLLEQIESSATSIAMNIAEGKGRSSTKQMIYFLHIARGSLFETVTLLHIFNKMSWIDTDNLERLENNAIELSKMINGLIKKVRAES